MIILAGSSNCIYCEYASEYLEFNNIEYEYVPYVQLPEFKQDRHFTVPQVYYRDHKGKVSLLLAGGYEGLKGAPIDELKELEVNRDV
jgi:glutaredoxin